MRRAMLFALGSYALLASFAAAPAVAANGALARDDATGKFGLSWDKPAQSQADEAALKDCGTAACKIVFRTTPHQCAAIATAETGSAWGAAYRPQRDGAALAAINDCQKHTAQQCKVRASGCNR